MSLKILADKVNSCTKDVSGWQQVREEIINRHEKSSKVEDYITLLSLYKSLMDAVELHMQDSVDIDQIREVRDQDYKMLITRECTIGDSVCIETLYELTQRELEAGRMGPEHSLINLAVDAIAEPHYSREQLLRQEKKIQKLENNVTLREKFSHIFRK